MVSLEFPDVDTLPTALVRSLLTTYQQGVKL